MCDEMLKAMCLKKHSVASDHSLHLFLERSEESYFREGIYNLEQFIKSFCTTLRDIIHPITA
jgi:hypothetical protein